jgi:hypothetical protein
MKAKALLNVYELLPTGKSDKPPPSGMFVTTHFKRRKDRYVQPSIMQH